MRPSEASGLRWSDVDLDAGIVRVVRSRHLWEDSAPKTGPSARTVELLPETVRLLRAIEPLRVTPEMPVFTNVDGGPIEPNSLLRHWYPCLHASGIRVRGLYAMKDTYISTALTAGVITSWLEAQTGVRYETMKRHYGKWLRLKGTRQLEKIARFGGQLAPQLPEDSEGIDSSEETECERGDLNPSKSLVQLAIFPPKTAKNRRQPPRIAPHGVQFRRSKKDQGGNDHGQERTGNDAKCSVISKDPSRDRCPGPPGPGP
jgi:hypothetical protein